MGRISMTQARRSPQAPSTLLPASLEGQSLVDLGSNTSPSIISSCLRERPGLEIAASRENVCGG
jgi:hypothetical protein